MESAGRFSDMRDSSIEMSESTKVCEIAHTIHSFLFYFINRNKILKGLLGTARKPRSNNLLEDRLYPQFMRL